ncbi:MAG: copper chaperone PCu(A)C [Rhizomicrobium sp.]|jgi:copper(I)-binding protein
MRQSSARAAIVAAALLAAALSASPGFAAPIAVSDAWFRALPVHLPAGGYFTLHNGSNKTVTLDAASSPACGMLMLHKSEEMSGMASMSDVARIDVPAGGTLSFAPGGYHLMCMNPTALLKQGTNVPVSLHLADGTAIAASFAVRSATGK